MWIWVISSFGENIYIPLLGVYFGRSAVSGVWGMHIISFSRYSQRFLNWLNQFTSLLAVNKSSVVLPLQQHFILPVFFLIRQGCHSMKQYLTVILICIFLWLISWAHFYVYLPFVYPLFSSVQSLSHIQLFAASWTTVCQASLSITNSQSLFKLMSIELVMPSNHLILCHPLLLPPSIFPSIRVFLNEYILHIRWPKHWSFSFTISPSNEYSGLIFFRMDWLDLLAV